MPTEKQWLLWAAGEWQVFHGAPMTLRWARDLTLIKPLLALHGEQELKARWRAHLHTLDEYLAKKGWNIPSFSESIDRYSGQNDRAQWVRRFNLRQKNKRDPLTGIKL